jgi:uncharacterized protein (DUF4415 family)
MKPTKAQLERLKKLADMPDEDIDTSDIPEVLDWSGAIRGGLYRPRKEAITIRLDADILAWFRDHTDGGKGYQSEINRALRLYVTGKEKQQA